LLGLT